MIKAINLIARELGNGTFDITCTADERMEIRRLINGLKLFISRFKL